MDALDPRACIDEVTERMIKRAARSLTRGALFRHSEREDIEQELRLDCLRRLQQYDAARGSRPAFVKLIIANKLATLYEQRKAARRDPRREAFSLDDSPPTDDLSGLTYEELLDPQECDPHVRRPSGHDHDLRVEIGRLIYGLTPHQAELCRRLMHETVTEVAAATGIPRGTLYEQVKRIRAAALSRGLGDYLDRRRFAIESGTTRRTDTRRRT